MLVLAADTRAGYDDVVGLYLPIAVAVFLAVTGLMALFIWRGRRRAAPSARSENNLAEGLYALGLAVIVAVLLSKTFPVDDTIAQRTASASALKVRVVAAKWHWRFEYPAQGVVVAGTDLRQPRLVVPSGSDIVFDATSLDVIHGFWVPAVKFQRQLLPDRVTRFVLRFPTPGLYADQPCSMFCGLRHKDMRFDVEVMDPARFSAWLGARRR